MKSVYEHFFFLGGGEGTFLPNLTRLADVHVCSY